MGASTIFDIVSAAIIGSILLLIALRLNAQAIETNAVYQNNLNLQMSIVSLVDIVEADFRKIGYCLDYTKIQPPGIAIVSADTSSIKFLTDIPRPPVFPYGDGVVDTIYYHLGDTLELMDTPNRSDRPLYRIENGNAQRGWSLGVTRFSLRYFDAEGAVVPTPVADPQEILTMEINISLESPAPLMRVEYRSEVESAADFKVYWRQIRLASRNLRNR